VLSNDTPTGNGGKGINGKSIKIITPLPLASGDAVVLPDSTIQFTPAANFTGTAIFEYTIEDRFGVVSDPAKVTVEIKALPRGANDLVKTTKDVAITAINVKNNDISKSGTTAHLSSTRPYLGQGIPDLSADGTFKYSPGPGFYGIDTVAYVLRNTSDNVESLPILIIINVNNPPIGKDTTYKASLNTPITIDIASLATDLDGTINKASVVINPSTTKGILMPIDALNGIYKYTPNNGTSGTDKFSYTIKDNAIPAAVSTANEVTIIIAPDPKIGLAKAASVTRSLNGTYDVKYKFILKNYGNEALQNISLKDDLGLAFTGADFIIKQSPVVTGTLVGNPSFNGFSDVELLSPVSVLGAGSTETVDITLNVKLTNKEGVFLNFAEAKATVSSNGSIVTDRSTSGFKPDPTTAGDVSPSDPTLIELKFPPLFIPGGFSPNNDGTNDLYVIRNTNNRKINIEVFNRWGNRVYKSSDYKNDWDGKCAEGLCLGQDLPPGTYYYIVLLDGIEKYTGYITLNR
jgi:gliding motility-associated-like protein